jgi:glutaredoxin 3
VANVVIYTTPWCPYCVRARRLLDDKGVAYTNINVSSDISLRNEMEQKSGRHTVPQIWINEHHVGGCDDLMALERAGNLDEMLRG